MPCFLFCFLKRDFKGGFQFWPEDSVKLSGWFSQRNSRCLMLTHVNLWTFNFMTFSVKSRVYLTWNLENAHTLNLIKWLKKKKKMGQDPLKVQGCSELPPRLRLEREDYPARIWLDCSKEPRCPGIAGGFRIPFTCFKSVLSWRYNEVHSSLFTPIGEDCQAEARRSHGPAHVPRAAGRWRAFVQVRSRAPRAHTHPCWQEGVFTYPRKIGSMGKGDMERARCKNQSASIPQ